MVVRRTDDLRAPFTFLASQAFTPNAAISAFRDIFL